MPLRASPLWVSPAGGRGHQGRVTRAGVGPRPFSPVSGPSRSRGFPTRLSAPAAVCGPVALSHGDRRDQGEVWGSASSESWDGFVVCGCKGTLAFSSTAWKAGHIARTSQTSGERLNEAAAMPDARTWSRQYSWSIFLSHSLLEAPCGGNRLGWNRPVQKQGLP